VATEVSVAATWLAISRYLRLTRSRITPTKGPRRRMGRWFRAKTSATAKGLPVTFSISQLTASRCIQLAAAHRKADTHR
jgi:hypothetical protein